MIPFDIFLLNFFRFNKYSEKQNSFISKLFVTGASLMLNNKIKKKLIKNQPSV